MKVLKTKWKQENGNTIQEAIITVQHFTVVRDDVEFLTVINLEEGVEWRSQIQINCIFNVYPDYECFEKRIFPTAVFSVGFLTVPVMFDVEEKTYNECVQYCLEKLAEGEGGLPQDFSSAQLQDVQLKYLDKIYKVK